MKTATLTELERQLVEARHNFIQQMEAYDARGRNLEARCERHLRKYWLDEQRRATEIVDAARECSIQINVFGGTTATLVSRVVLVLNALELRATRIAMSALDDAMRGIGRGVTLSEETYVNDALVAANIALSGIALATPVFEMRMQALSAFLGDSEDADGVDLLQAMIRAATDIAREQTLETMLELAAPRTTKIVRTALDYYSKVRADLDRLALPYAGFGDVDQLFSFRGQLTGQRSAFTDISEALLLDIDLLITKDDG